MIHEILPRVFSNAYLPRPPEADDYLLFYHSDSIWLTRGAEEKNESPGGSSETVCEKRLRLPRFCEVDEAIRGTSPQYLFNIGDTAFYYLQANEEILSLLSDKLLRRRPEALRGINKRWLAFAGITATHLAGWYEKNKFCGKCGGITSHAENMRMIKCPVCGTQVFPAIAPAVIVGVTDGDRLLLTRYANRPFKNYALIAGFAEIGESIEETVRREVMEEVGLSVKNINFYKSQPWGFSGSLLMGFYCELNGSDTITLDETELAVAEWHSRKTIPPAEADISLTGEMIERFRKGKSNYASSRNAL